MADFFQAPQNDPDAIRRMIMQRIFGGGTPAIGTPPFVPGGTPPRPNGSPVAAPVTASAPSSAQPGAPGTAGSEENSGAPRATPIMNGARATSPNGGRSVAKPIGAAAANNNSGNMEPGNAPPFPDEPTWQKQNPGPAHTPYVAPDLKHRMLMGLFAGLQNFGHDPGAAERMLGSYLGDIQRKTEEEKNYPQTAAAEAHQRYMTAAQGAEVPLHIQNLKAMIDKSEAEAWARSHPQAKTRPVKIADPTNQDPHGIPATQNMVTGEITDQEGKVIPNAKLWERPQKEERPFNLDEQEFEARQSLRSAKTPDERATAQARIEDIRASRQRPPEERSPKDSHLTPGQKATENRKYQKALDDIEAERRARETGTYVHPHTQELMPPMTNDELFDRKQRAEDEYKDALEAAGETGVRRFNYRTGQYEGGEQPAARQPARPLATAKAGEKPNGKAAPAPHQVNDEVIYQGKRHKITAIQNGKAQLQPLE